MHHTCQKKCNDSILEMLRKRTFVILSVCSLLAHDILVEAKGRGGGGGRSGSARFVLLWTRVRSDYRVDQNFTTEHFTEWSTAATTLALVPDSR